VLTRPVHSLFVAFLFFVHISLLLLLLVHAAAGGMRLGLGGETVQAITLDSLNLTDVSLMKVRVAR
jgi:hypothetical protein